MGHGPLSPEELTKQEELETKLVVEQRMEDEKVRQQAKIYCGRKERSLKALGTLRLLAGMLLRIRFCLKMKRTKPTVVKLSRQSVDEGEGESTGVEDKLSGRRGQLRAGGTLLPAAPEMGKG